VRRQAEAWMRDATRDFANGRTAEAIAAYSRAGVVHAAESRDAARVALIDRWDSERRAEPGASRIILTHMNKEVAVLNDAARATLAEQGALGESVTIRTERGVREFAEQDRILFLKNERDLGVKNGTLGTVEKAAPDRLAVRLDDGRRIDVDLKSYRHVDHGYAATVHKTQGMTVDRTHVLATPGLDAHASYVALSRHRHGTALHYGRDDFADERALRQTLGRERPKDMALDYRDSVQQRSAAKTSEANDRDVRPAQTERAAVLRAMVAARVNAPKHTAETIRDALAKAADTLTGLGRGRDRGAER
jgi:ATP-dependent exoDNAse (exonuclease V) alpha subunit